MTIKSGHKFFTIFSFYLTCLFIACLFPSCSDDFDKKYYQNVTGIRFPEKYEVLETFDNAEWLTGTVLEADSLDLRALISKYHFNRLNVKEGPYMGSLNFPYFKLKRPDYKTNNELFFLTKDKESGKTGWTYVVDMKTNRIWMVINYLDWGGN